MNVNVFLLFASFAFLAALPIIPALIHLLGADTTAFLDIPSDRNDDPRHFSRRLKAIVDSESPQSTRLLKVRSGSDLSTASLYKSPFSSSRPLRQAMQRAGEHRIALLPPRTGLTPGLQWFGDTLAQSDIEVPSDTLLRTLRCEGQCLLQPHSTIVRWLDARSVFVMGPNRLPPRTTASQSISLSTDIRFERMHAPIIHVLPAFAEHGQKAVDAHLPPLPPDVDIWRFDTDEDLLSGRKVFNDDVYIVANTALSCDLVCHGDLHVGSGCTFQGNLKVKGDLFLHSNVRIRGHVLCEGNVTLDHGCDIDGVMTAMRHLGISGGCILGSAHAPTSLIADTVSLHAGVRIHGQIWARHEGITHA